jgi:N-acetylglucosaminyldiphosphoundecaprenol N-acetyl-beta-D-mannosaminyltransferase
MSKVPILGVEFDNLDFHEFQNEFISRLNNHLSTLVVTANPEIVMAAREDPYFMRIINEDADFVTPDGIGVVKAAQMLKTPLKERVTGYDLFVWLMQVADLRGLRVYLLGAKPEVIAAVRVKVANDYPGINLVGAYDGYFQDSLEDEAKKIAATQPDLVFAAIGYPRQEELLAILRRSDVPALMMGVGGSFDAFSGAVKRAPKVVQRVHMEWFYRLVKNPSRFKRSLVLPKFVAEVRRAKRGRRHKK